MDWCQQRADVSTVRRTFFLRSRQCDCVFVCVCSRWFIIYNTNTFSSRLIHFTNDMWASSITWTNKCKIHRILYNIYCDIRLYFFFVIASRKRSQYLLWRKRHSNDIKNQTCCMMLIVELEKLQAMRDRKWNTKRWHCRIQK